MQCARFCSRGRYVHSLYSHVIKIELNHSMIHFDIEYTGKTITDKKEVTALLRHKDVRICGMGAMALQLFSSYHVAQLPSPNYTSNQTW